jgi:very-short-patch-repair endonuclease
VHGDSYTYEIAEYRNNLSKLKISCAEHGSFLQAASSHLQGAGCPRCSSSRGEKTVAAVLSAKGIDFIPQFMHETCRGQRRRLPFDFAIPAQRVLIEFDGIHHREPVRWAYSITEERAQEMLKHRQYLDGIKGRWAVENHWTLIRLTDEETVEEDLLAHGVLSRPLAASQTRALSNMASLA